MIPALEQLVRISVSNESSAYGALVDRCVVSRDGGLLLLSVVAPAGIVKGIAASLSKNGPAVRLTIDSQAPFVRGTKTVKTWDYDLGKHVEGPVIHYYDTLRRHEEGYVRHLHKMAYGHAQAIFVAKQPGLLLNTSPQSLAAVLRDPAVCTTPFLPEWVPYIAEELRARKIMNDLDGFQCRAAILRPGSTKAIDEIVLEGGRNGRISIPA